MLPYFGLQFQSSRANLPCGVDSERDAECSTLKVSAQEILLKNESRYFRRARLLNRNFLAQEAENISLNDPLVSTGFFSNVCFSLSLNGFMGFDTCFSRHELLQLVLTKRKVAFRLVHLA